MHITNSRNFIGAAVIASALLAPFAAGAAGIPIDEARGGIPTLAPILELRMPGVVSIAVQGTAQGQRNGQQVQRQTQGAGSGVIVDAAKGYILTNNHVVDGANKITVGLSDGRVLDAKVLGRDDQTDIALVQVTADRLTALPLGDSNSLRVGDFVIAIGNPFGLSQTVTSGIISALGRGNMGIEGYEDFIQTDASINPGNSGGALIDMNGKLIGINTAIVGPSGGNIGIGFAVPVNMVRSVMDQLIAYGDVKRGRLGVGIADISPATTGRNEATIGALITSIQPGSAAEQAGLAVNDVVVSFNGAAVRDARDLANRVGLVRVGGTAEVIVLRSGARKTFAVKVLDGQQANAADPIVPRPANYTGALNVTAPASVI